ncbi:MAG: aldo/keto reductase, partial [Chloroflexota bacterium]
MTTQVETIEIAPDLTVSRVLTGLWQIADMERHGSTLDPVTTAEKMTPYFDAGLTTFDMADHYGSAEIITGTFRQSIQDQSKIQLFTKWVPKPGVVTQQEVRDAVKLSLDRMQMPQIDLLQFHCWNYADPAWLDTLFMLQDLKDEGLIRHLGMTNIDSAHLRMAVKSGIKLVTNQVSFSMLDMRASTKMAAACQELGLHILAFGTLAGGFLTERWLGQPEPDWDNLQTWSQMKYGRYIREAGGWIVFQELLQAMKQVANKLSVSMANVACKYILDQPAVAAVIIGARLGENQHIADNLRLFEFEFDDGSRQLLGDALAQLK